MRQLAAKTALLHAAEGHAGVAGAVAIEEDAAALQLAGKALGLRLVGGIDRGGQAKLAVVGEGQCMVSVASWSAAASSSMATAPATPAWPSAA